MSESGLGPVLVFVGLVTSYLFRTNMVSLALTSLFGIFGAKYTGADCSRLFDEILAKPTL